MLNKFMLPIYKQKRVQRLLRLGAAGRTPPEADEVKSCRQATALQRSVRAVIERLDGDSVKSLCETVESGGEIFGGCVRLPLPVPEAASVETASGHHQLHQLCRFFRWPQLHVNERLVTLPVCKMTDGCCLNPYHWSRLYNPGGEDVQISACDPGHVHSADNSLTDLTNGDCGATWCRIFYSEFRRRVGRLGGWPVQQRVQHVFHALPRGCGLSLSNADGALCTQDSELYRRRQRHIGAGLTLWLNNDSVWLYNRSERPLFVASDWLTRVSDIGYHGDNKSDGAAWPVHRLQPGHSTLVHRPIDAARLTDSTYDVSAPTNPASRCVTVSFAKGWGSGFRRSSPLACPHWLEIWLCEGRDVL